MSEALPAHKALSMCLCAHIYMYLKVRGVSKLMQRASYIPNPYANAGKLGCKFRSCALKNSETTEVASLSGFLPAAGCFGVLVPVIPYQEPCPREVVPGLAAVRAFG